MKIVSVCENSQLGQPQIIGSNVFMPGVEAPGIKMSDTKMPDAEPSRIIQNKPQVVPAVIKVVSAGGGGANALNRMKENGLSGVQFISVNTDIQDLYDKSLAETKVQIGSKLTGGRGAGGKPEVGEKAALEDRESLVNALSGADMVFITACMGGGTGTGSAPVLAEISMELGILTVAVVTTPFNFEGRYKMGLAMDGIKKLRGIVDTLIVIPNQYLFKLIDRNTPLDKAYQKADAVLRHGVQGISDLITKVGYQNTDFSDVETIMKGKGDALMGIGIGTGENRAKDAVAKAIDNPLLEDTSMEGATGVLVNVAAASEVSLIEIDEMISAIKDKCDPDVHVIHGVNIDPSLGDSIQLTVIATGFQNAPAAEIKKTGTKKTSESDFIDYGEYVRMREKTKKPDYLGFLPQREYQEDLDVPSVIRNHDYNASDKTGKNIAENG